jgi:integrase
MHVFYPFLLRLLYGCGLRISEALNLKLDDIDMSERVIRIEQAKNNNSRLIPLSPSLADALNRYLEQMQYERGYKGFLFVNQHGKPYRSNTVLTRFKRLLAQAGIPARENGRTPRLHDLRHTFAVHSLDQMVENGMDAYCVLPYLSTYMGHRNISCTEQYLRLTNQSFRHITAATEPMYTGLFPRGGAE